MIKFKTKIPIYDLDLFLILTEDIRTSAELLNIDNLDSFHFEHVLGLSVVKELQFFLFLDKNSITHKTIAHEIFHLTHYIMEALENRYSNRGSEAYSYLAGWLADFVYKKLKKIKIKV